MRLYRESFNFKKHPTYNAFAYYLLLYLKNHKTYLMHVIELCEKLKQLDTIDIEKIEQKTPAVVINIDGKRIIEYFKITEDCYLTNAYDKDTGTDCLLLVSDEDKRKWKISFQSKDCQDFITEDEVEWHVKMCKLSKEKREQEPDKKWQVVELVFIDEEHKEKFKEVLP